MAPTEPAVPTKRHWSVERWLFVIVFVGCLGVGVWLASQGPDPAGYNIITGVRPQDGKPYGPTWANISQGLGTAFPVGLILGGILAGLVRLVRKILGR